MKEWGLFQNTFIKLLGGRGGRADKIKISSVEKNYSFVPV